MQSHQSPKLKTEEGSNWRSPADILDVHQQLRHEASGLRLQLASKQEVLERTVRVADGLAAEVHQMEITLESQANMIQELTSKLKMAQKREAHLRAELETLLKQKQTTPDSGRNYCRRPGEDAPVEHAFPDTLANVNNLHERHDLMDDSEGDMSFETTPCGKLTLRFPGPSPMALKLPVSEPRSSELATYCKITMAARASSRPGSARSNGETVA